MSEEIRMLLIVASLIAFVALTVFLARLGGKPARPGQGVEPVAPEPRRPSKSGRA